MSTLETRLQAFLTEHGLAEAELSTPPQADFGDLATAWPLKQAKLAKQLPLAIAEAKQLELVAEQPAWLAEISVTPPGFLNFRFADHALWKQALTVPEPTQFTGGKIVLEHTSVNPNKAAHIGHVRNGVLGDSLARLLRAAGRQVEVQNYIDDTGVQVADVVFAEQFLGQEPPVDQRVDYWAWDIYSQIQPALTENEGLRHQRDEVMHLLEQRDPVWAARAEKLSSAILKRQLETFARLGIGYDAAVFESSILEAGLWRQTFEALQNKGVIKQETAGPNAGAWIIPFGGTMTLEDGSKKSLDKIIVKSNGTATYLAKDLAYQLGPAKFGVITAPLKYNQQSQPGSKNPLWSSLHGQSQAPVGGAEETITLIDQRQRYLRDVLREALSALGYPVLAEHDQHFSYEVVSLSPAAARDLGLDVADAVQSVTMSGRKGIGIKADDLFDRVRLAIVERGTDANAADLLTRAAIRYTMLKVNPETELVFDFEEATRTTGDTGVYLCYAAARAQSLLKKGSKIENADLDSEPLEKTERALLLALSRTTDVLNQAALLRSPSLVARYVYELAGRFTNFYEDPLVGPIVRETNADIKNRRLQLVAATYSQLIYLLDLLGITVPSKM